jgi:hypothetical protein
MTTGRINQVTTFHPCRAREPLQNVRVITAEAAFAVGSSLFELIYDLTAANTSVQPEGVLASKSQQLNRLVPRSHILQTHFSLSQAATEIMAFRENYQQPVTSLGCRTVAADSQVVKCDRFSYQQVIHIIQHCEHR